MKQFILLFLLVTLFSKLFVVKAQKSMDANPVVQINHVALYVYDLDKCREFYEKVVQLKRIAEPFKDGLHEWFSLGGGAQLHLIKGAKEISEHDKHNHLCFSVASLDDYMTNLKKYKVSYTNWLGDSDTPTLRADGIKQIYFKDPEGYWIEINNDYKKR